SGAVNVVTRSGGNEFHGTAFYFFRDHKLSAYPALARDPFNPDPFFQRGQFGLAAGGPILNDRVFFFANWERNDQRGVAGARFIVPDFAHFSRITPSLFFDNQLSGRLDGRLKSPHAAFLRYSHDGSRGYGPSSFNVSSSLSNNLPYPSSWTRQPVWADQSVLGLTSVFRPSLVNELRFSYFFISSGEVAPREEDCPACLGIGAPTILVARADLQIGNSSASYNLGRRFHLHDSVSWQHGTHRIRFGADWEHHRGGLMQWLNEPVTMTLFPPDEVRRYNALHQTPPELRIPLPGAFQTLNDILQLPLESFTVGIGDPRVPQENGGNVRHWNVARLYMQDVWRLHPRLTLNYGLGWSVDRNFNHDLPKPAFLAPIFGTEGLGPARKQWKNFSPTLGVAWAPVGDGKTVVRAGGGIYYGALLQAGLDVSRAALLPPGLGRQNIQGSSVLNPLSGIPGVPVGSSLDFRGNPTRFTGADLMQILPGVRSSLAQSLTAKGDPTLRAIEITKQAIPQLGGLLYPTDYPTPSATHVSTGIQRQITRDFVLSADFAYRHFIHLPSGPGGVDLNRFNRPAGPVIPRCTAAQATDPKAPCSNGQISVQLPMHRAKYRGLLFRADKRLSQRYLIIGSYAWSRNTGTFQVDLDDWLANRGPLRGDFTHITNSAAVVQLPRRFELGIIFSYSSAPPFNPFVGGIDFNGDGTSNDALPDAGINGFNRGLGRSDLVRLVEEFNQTWARRRDPFNRLVPRLTLPANYWFNDDFHTLDLRLTRSFVFRERWRLSVIGEVFNVYNAANLSGHSANLTSAGFGQPTARTTQIFGSGGPRAFELAMRVSF
ncbi:MAG: hypothetical protein L0Z50_36220, partial [Verrucomicrobiales bacterium]|nr:hypothetical protein [Verrucomicrobiales bacterium]